MHELSIRTVKGMPKISCEPVPHRNIHLLKEALQACLYTTLNNSQNTTRDQTPVPITDLLLGDL